MIGTGDLSTDCCYSATGVQVASLSSPSIALDLVTSPAVVYQSSPAAGTPQPRGVEALTLFAIPGETQIGTWKLQMVLLVQVTYTRRTAVANTWLEGIAEYGTGRSDEEAILDLIDSLGEYREALEARADTLGEDAVMDLGIVKRLIERSHELPATPSSPHSQG